jgi:hypothetical protein
MTPLIALLIAITPGETKIADYINKWPACAHSYNNFGTEFKPEHRLCRFTLPDEGLKTVELQPRFGTLYSIKVEVEKKLAKKSLKDLEKQFGLSQKAPGDDCKSETVVMQSGTVKKIERNVTPLKWASATHEVIACDFSKNKNLPADMQILEVTRKHKASKEDEEKYKKALEAFAFEQQIKRDFKIKK